MRERESKVGHRAPNQGLVGPNRTLVDDPGFPNSPEKTAISIDAGRPPAAEVVGSNPSASAKDSNAHLGKPPVRVCFSGVYGGTATVSKPFDGIKQRTIAPFGTTTRVPRVGVQSPLT